MKYLAPPVVFFLISTYVPSSYLTYLRYVIRVSATPYTPAFVLSLTLALAPIASDTHHSPLTILFISSTEYRSSKPQQLKIHT